MASIVPDSERHHGQTHHELTAAARAFTLCFNRPGVHAHQILNECESNTQSAFRPRQRPVALLKKLKDAREQVRRDAAAIVDYSQHRGIPLMVHADRNLPAGRSEFHGIVQ